MPAIFQEIHVRVRGLKNFHVRVRDLKNFHVRVHDFKISHVRVRDFPSPLSKILVPVLNILHSCQSDSKIYGP